MMAPTLPSSSGSRTRRWLPAEADSASSRQPAMMAARKARSISLLPFDLGEEAGAAHRHRGDRRAELQGVGRQLGDDAGDVEQRAAEEIDDEGEAPFGRGKLERGELHARMRPEDRKSTRLNS